MHLILHENSLVRRLFVVIVIEEYLIDGCVQSSAGILDILLLSS